MAKSSKKQRSKMAKRSKKQRPKMAKSSKKQRCIILRSVRLDSHRWPTIKPGLPKFLSRKRWTPGSVYVPCKSLVVLAITSRDCYYAINNVQPEECHDESDVMTVHAIYEWRGQGVQTTQIYEAEVTAKYHRRLTSLITAKRSDDCDERLAYMWKFHGRKTTLDLKSYCKTIIKVYDKFQCSALLNYVREVIVQGGDMYIVSRSVMKPGYVGLQVSEFYSIVCKFYTEKLNVALRPRAKVKMIGQERFLSDLLIYFRQKNLKPIDYHCGVDFEGMEVNPTDILFFSRHSDYGGGEEES